MSIQAKNGAPPPSRGTPPREGKPRESLGRARGPGEGGGGEREREGGNSLGRWGGGPSGGQMVEGSTAPRWAS